MDENKLLLPPDWSNTDLNYLLLLIRKFTLNSLSTPVSKTAGEDAGSTPSSSKSCFHWPRCESGWQQRWKPKHFRIVICLAWFISIPIKIKIPEDPLNKPKVATLNKDLLRKQKSNWQTVNFTPLHFLKSTSNVTFSLQLSLKTSIHRCFLICALKHLWAYIFCNV